MLQLSNNTAQSYDSFSSHNDQDCCLHPAAGSLECGVSESICCILVTATIMAGVASAPPLRSSQLPRRKQSQRGGKEEKADPIIQQATSYSSAALKK